MDIAAPKSSNESLVHGSGSSKYLGEFKEEVYDFLDSLGKEDESELRIKEVKEKEEEEER